jgi:hypothetical protein
MMKRIKITISKEDIYSIENLMQEIRNNPGTAHNLCESYGLDHFPKDYFADFESLNSEDQERVVEEYASAKSNFDAQLSEEQEEKFDLFVELFEEE